MTLSEKINQDLKDAMKSGDRTKLETLRLIRAHLIELSKRGTGKETTPDEELSVLTGAIKKRKEAIELYEKGGRMDLADQERKELDVITTYLPQQMSREEAGEVVQRIIRETGSSSTKDFGKVMSLAMKELKGRIEGKAVQEIVKERLGA
jgi:uncharacterized protein YqeY